MSAQTGPSKSAFKRYVPFIAVVAVIAIVIGIIAVTGGDDDKKDTTSTTAQQAAAKAPWVSYAAAKAAGEVDKYQWGDNCDTSRGQVKLPMYDAPPCMAPFTGDNGGDLDPDHGITKDKIRIAWYSAPTDVQADALAKSVGGYDSPGAIEDTNRQMLAKFAEKVELYGRKIELVKLQGTGTGANEQAAQADAVTAKSLKVFAVLGGPAQTKSFSETLAHEGILCIGTCLIARPASFYKENSPYIWPGIEPDQTSALNVEFVKKQLAGKKAEWAGDSNFKNQTRTFALLNYDTPDGGYKPVWDSWKKQFADAGVPIKGQVTYYLNIPTVQADAQSLIQKLKAVNATTVIFTGDPFSPIYFTKEATKQGYFPEWVMSGTVFADTSVFGRQFDQQQWSHAFGMSLIAPRIPRNESRYYAMLTDCGTGSAPKADNTQGIIYANQLLLFNGLTLAGPKLSAKAFYDGMTNFPLLERDADHLRAVASYGDHGIWPDGSDYGSTDTTGFVFWDPNAPGEDETSTAGKGQYRYFDNGKQYLPGEIPTEAMKFFDDANTVTYYDNSGKYEGTKPIPDALKPLPCQN